MIWRTVFALLLTLGIAAPGGVPDMPTIYGPQLWTAGAFNHTGHSPAWQPTTWFGSDTPDANYPELAYVAGAHTVPGAGPSGETVIDATNTADYTDAGVSLGGLGSLNGDGSFDVRGPLHITWKQKPLSSALNEAGVNWLLSVHGQGDRATSLDVNGIPFNITQQQTTGSSFTWDLVYRKISFGGFANQHVTSASGTVDDAWHNYELILTPATVTGAYDGLGGNTGASVASDGAIQFLVDGVAVYNLTGLVFVINEMATSNPEVYYANGVSFGDLADMGGPSTALHLFTAASSAPPQIDTSTPCCSTGVSNASASGGGTAGSVLGPDTSAPLEPWTPRSAGGGVLPSGIAVTHAEDWRTLFGSTPDIWVEILQKPYPTGSTVTRRVAMQAMAYPTLIEGRVTTAGWSTMEHALSDWRGNPEAGTLAAMVTDTDGMFRGMADTMGRTAYAKADTSFKILSEAGRKSGKTARILQRGVLASAPVPQPGRTAQIQTVDLLGSSWFVDVSAPLQSLLITRELLNAAGLTNTPSGNLGKPFPIVVGEHSDNGALTSQVLNFAGVQAYAFFTISANVSNGDTVTLGSVTYTFETVFSNSANHVLIGVDALTSKQNLVAAINRDAGIGTTYGTGTTANPTVEAEIPATLGGGLNTAATVVARYRTVGVVGNGTPVSTTASVGTWFHEGGIATSDLHGGADASVVPISAEKGLIPGIDLGDAQVTGSGQVASWAGVQAYAFFTISANVSNGDTVTIGSVTYTFKTVFSNSANHVLIGVDALTSKQNLVAAVNGGAGIGTIYGTGTTTNPTVVCDIPANLGGGPNTAATIVARYRTVGVVGDGTPVSTTATVGTWFHEGGIATTDLHGGSDPSVLGVVPPPVLAGAVVGTPGTRTFSYDVCLGTAAGQTLPSNIVTITTAPDVFDASNYVQLTWAPPTGWEDIYTALAIGFRVCGRLTATPTKTLAIVDGAAREYHDGELGGVAHTDPEIDPGPPAMNTATVVTTSDGNPSAVVSGSNTWGVFCFHLGYGHLDDIFASNLADGATPGRTLIDPTTSPYLLTPASPGWPHADPWIEIVGADGQVIRFTGCYLGGPLLAQQRAGTVTIAANGWGPTDDGTATGAPISEASVGFGWIMNQFALQQNWDARTPWPLVTFADGTQVLDVAALNAFQTYTVGRIGGRGYQMHLYIGDLVTVAQFLAWFNLTFTTYSGPNDDGQYGVWAIDETATPASAPIYRQHIEIDVTLPAPTIATDEVENRLRYHFDWDPDGQAWRGDEETVQDLPSQALYGLRDASTDPSSFLQLQATRDAATARDAMARRLFHNKVAPVYQPIPVSLIGLEAPIGSLVRVTHPDGLGTNGYVARPFFIIRKMLALTAPNQTVTMTARDVYRVYNPDAGTMLDGSGADALPFVMA